MKKCNTPEIAGCSEHYVIHVLRDDPAFVKRAGFHHGAERAAIHTVPPSNRHRLKHAPSCFAEPVCYNMDGTERETGGRFPASLFVDAASSRMIK